MKQFILLSYFLFFYNALLSAQNQPYIKKNLDESNFVQIIFFNNIQCSMGRLPKQMLVTPIEEDCVSFDTIFLFGRIIVNDIVNIIENLVDTAISDNKINYWAVLKIKIDTNTYTFFMDEFCVILKNGNKTYFDKEQTLQKYFFYILTHKFIATDEKKLLNNFKKKFN